MNSPESKTLLILSDSCRKLQTVQKAAAGVIMMLSVLFLISSTDMLIRRITIITIMNKKAGASYKRGSCFLVCLKKSSVQNVCLCFDKVRYAYFPVFIKIKPCIILLYSKEVFLKLKNICCIYDCRF